MIKTYGLTQVALAVKRERGGIANDFFSIQFGNGYSADGFLISGNIAIH